jgi:hypothetical protein
LSAPDGVRARIKPGPGITASRKPMPSTARSTSNHCTACAPPTRPAPTAPPSTLATVSTMSPVSMLRRRPMLSAASPAMRPSVMLATCTNDSRNPASTNPMPSDACSAGTAGGSLPRCKAALTPPSMTA